MRPFLVNGWNDFKNAAMRWKFKIDAQDGGLLWKTEQIQFITDLSRKNNNRHSRGLMSNTRDQIEVVQVRTWTIKQIFKSSYIDLAMYVPILRWACTHSHGCDVLGMPSQRCVTRLQQSKTSNIDKQTVGRISVNGGFGGRTKAHQHWAQLQLTIKSVDKLKTVCWIGFVWSWCLHRNGSGKCVEGVYVELDGKRK